MDQPGLEPGKDDVDGQRLLGDAENEGRNQYQGPHHQRLEKVQPRSGEPVHVLDRMMHGMDRPEPFDLVQGAMDRVLDKIGQDDGHDELNGPGQ